VPWQALDFVHGQLRWWASRPQLKRQPLGSHTCASRRLVSCCASHSRVLGCHKRSQPGARR